MLASVLATEVLSDVVLLPWLWAEDEVSVARVMACIPKVRTRIAKYFTASPRSRDGDGPRHAAAAPGFFFTPRYSTTLHDVVRSGSQPDSFEGCHASSFVLVPIKAAYTLKVLAGEWGRRHHHVVEHSDGLLNGVDLSRCGEDEEAAAEKPNVPDNDDARSHHEESPLELLLSSATAASGAGPLSSSCRMGMLSHLQSLVLRDRAVTLGGNEASIWPRLTALTELDMNGCGLVNDEFLGAVCSSCCLPAQLRRLDIGSTFVTGTGLRRYLDCSGGCCPLTYLGAAGINLREDDGDAGSTLVLASQLGSLPALRAIVVDGAVGADDTFLTGFARAMVRRHAEKVEVEEQRPSNDPVEGNASPPLPNMNGSVILLTSLSLAQCDVTDVGVVAVLEAIAPPPPVARCLADGGGHDRRRGDDYAGLVHVNLSYCGKITDVTLMKGLARHRQLRSAVLEGTRITYRGLCEALTGVPLVTLDVSRLKPHGPSSLPPLREREASSAPPDPANPFPQLRSLKLTGLEFPSLTIVLAAIAASDSHGNVVEEDGPGLATLWIDCTDARSHELQILGTSPALAQSLRSLVLDCTTVTDDGLVHLRGLRYLTELRLYDCRITDVGAAHLAAIPSLETLDLSFTDIGDAALFQFSGCATGDDTPSSQESPERETTYPTAPVGPPSSSHDFPQRPGGLQRLEQICLTNCQTVTDAGLRSLGYLPSLRVVSVFYCPLISETCVSWLRRIVHVKQ